MPLPPPSVRAPSARSATPYRDPTGATLADYPQPSLAVDTAVLTLARRTSPGLLADPNGVRLAPVTRSGSLPYDHKAIVAAAVRELRRRYADHPDPERLLGPRFTIRELLDVHRAVAGLTLQKDTFRRAMGPHLRGAGILSSGTVGRPSQRFRRTR